MSLNVDELASKILDAFKEQLSDKWPEVKDYAESESKKLAENFVLIEKLKISGKITERQAKFHYEIQKNASRSVLLAVDGLSLIAVEQAINAAMEVLKDAVNKALGFSLL